jgi:hypothetical protein
MTNNLETTRLNEHSFVAAPMGETYNIHAIRIIFSRGFLTLERRHACASLGSCFVSALTRDGE